MKMCGTVLFLFAMLVTPAFATDGDKPFACSGTLAIADGEVHCVTTNTVMLYPNDGVKQIVKTTMKRLLTTYQEEIPDACILRALKDPNHKHDCTLKVRGFRVEKATASFFEPNPEGGIRPAITLSNERWKWAWTVEGIFFFTFGIFLLSLIIFFPQMFESSTGRLPILRKVPAAIIGGFAMILVFGALGVPYGSSWVSTIGLLGSIGTIGWYEYLELKKESDSESNKQP